MLRQSKRQEITVGSFPYDPGGNPYQRLFTGAIEDAGLRVVRIPPRKLMPLQYALSHTFDVLHLDWPHDWYNGRNKITRLAKSLVFQSGVKRLEKTPSVWTVHNLGTHGTSDAEYDETMLQLLIDSVDALVVMSRSAEAELRKKYRVSDDKIVSVIPHGHYIDEYPNEITKEAARDRLGIRHGQRVLLSLGRILPYKGLEDLIEAFSTVSSSQDVLLIAGNAPNPAYIDKLTKLASGAGKVQILNEFVADDELQCYLNAADFVVLPFTRILNSGSAILALSFGKTIIAPDQGSIREIAPDHAIYCYERGRKDGLKQLIAAVLSGLYQPADPNPIIESMRARYSWDSIGRQLSHLYFEILSSDRDTKIL